MIPEQAYSLCFNQHCCSLLTVGGSVDGESVGKSVGFNVGTSVGAWQLRDSSE